MKMIKKGKGYLKIKRNKGKLWIPIALTFQNEDHTLKLEEIFETGTVSNNEDIYDMPEIAIDSGAGSPVTYEYHDPYIQTIGLFQYKSCTIKPESGIQLSPAGTTNSEKKTLQIITFVPVGLISRTVNKVRIGFLSRPDADDWVKALQNSFRGGTKRGKRGSTSSSAGGGEIAAVLEAASVPVKSIHPKIEDEILDLQLEDNDVYESSLQYRFQVSIYDTDKSLELGFHGDYNLVVSDDSLDLMHLDTGELLHQWYFKTIRQYGCTHSLLSFEAGSQSKGGPGRLIFSSPRAQEILETIKICKAKMADKKQSYVLTARAEECRHKVERGHVLSVIGDQQEGGEDEYSVVDLDKKHKERQARLNDPIGSLGGASSSSSLVPPPVSMPTFPLNDSNSSIDTKSMDNHQNHFIPRQLEKYQGDLDDGYDTIAISTSHSSPDPRHISLPVIPGKSTGAHVIDSDRII